MLLVYTHKITPRVKYTFKQLCTRILGIEVSFTTKVEDFIAHQSMKISYTKQPLSSEIFIRSHELLFEQGLSDIDINVTNWENTKCFFANGEQSALPFDIFAATFYLLSRYEEYLPHVKDDYGRFTAKQSLAYKNNFLKQPVVDIWAYKFKALLQKHYPEIILPNRLYSITPIIDVPCAYLYKNKGIMRTIGATIKDIFRLKFTQIYNRFAVLLQFKKDPYDTYKYIINKQKQCGFKFVVFFLVGNLSTYDKNINIQKAKFVSLIKQLSDYCRIGLKTSYFAIENNKILKTEKSRIENIINTSLTASRQSFSKLNLPKSYRNLIELEILEDYTMGYTTHLGFRAGTCTPFLFYDLDYEIQTPLKVTNYHVLDFALLKHQSLLDKKMILQQIINQVKQVNGNFVPVFHNYTFSNISTWQHYKSLFNIILNSVNET